MISGEISGGSTDDPKKDRPSQESTQSGLVVLARHHENALTCIQCSKVIKDKRWICMENRRGVLCNKCWKNMYLPKVLDEWLSSPSP